MNETTQNVLQTLLTWGYDKGLTIIAILVGTWILLKLLKNFMAKIIRRMVPHGAFASEFAERRREDTLIKIARRTIGVFVWVAAFFAILDTLGVPLTPLITGAGIIGVGIGFGSQSLVKDVINGLFIIAENQYRIGDVVTIAGVTGTVEDVTLRVTKLREVDGTIHYVPNGEIKVTSNESKDYSMVDLKVGVAYNVDVDAVADVINQIGLEMAEDPELSSHIIEAPYFLRVHSLGDYSVTLRILAKVYPKEQYLITGELRKRILKRFKEKGIEIPYPTNVQYSRIEK